MSTLLATSPQTQSDADLVAASRKGDREAFGGIVRRYQAMITGVLYASCGDLHRSEDLAQDTFVSAWKSLSGLREPSKLPAWLCQVARHRLLDNARSESRHDNRLARAFHGREESAAPSPEEQVLSEEERELLWKTLREIPQPYRETLVLYYRQGKSADDVALAMDTTEANVRQRLTRGREMLREQVAAMVERNLVRSAPSAAFAVAVIAALPALIPQTAAAATIGAVSLKGSAAAKSGGLLAVFAMWIGPILGVLGGVLGTWMSIRNTKTPRERKFMVRTAVWTWVLVVGFLATQSGVILAQMHYRWPAKIYVTLMVGLWIVYATMLTAFIIVANRRHRAIRREEGIPMPTALPNDGKHLGMGMAGATVGALAWMVALAGQAGDTLSVTIVIAAAAILSAVPLKQSRGRSIEAARRFVVPHCVLLALITAVMVNWRFHGWMAASNHISLDTARQRIPLWILNVFVAVIYTFICMTMHVSLRRAKTNGQEQV